MTEFEQAIERFLAKCSADPILKQRMLVDAETTMRALGINLVEGIRIKANENENGQLVLTPYLPSMDLSDEMLESISGGGLIFAKPPITY